MIKTIMLDIDDVLTQFSKGYCEFVNEDYEALVRHYLPTDGWSPNPALSRMLDLDPPQTAQMFYRPLQGYATFWLNLEPHSWMKALLDLCKQYTEDIWLVTAPGPCSSSYSGKVRWIQRHFGREFDKFHLTPHKERVALPGSVLIDDREHNINKFITTGFTHDFECDGVLFPQPYNAAAAWSQGCNEVRLDYVARQLSLIAAHKHPTILS